MLLNQMVKKLEEIESNVFYGLAMEEDIPQLWNYAVVARDKLRKGGSSKCDYNRYYKVVIVREDCIPEDYEKEVINKMLEIKGLRLADNEFPYNYGVKKSTDVVVESLELVFCKAEKGSA